MISSLNFICQKAVFPPVMCKIPLCALQVWTGLRFLGEDWFWSDGSTVNQQEMLPKCPAQWKFCGAVSKNGIDEWMIVDCSERKNFICSRTTVGD